MDQFCYFLYVLTGLYTIFLMAPRTAEAVANIENNTSLPYEEHANTTIYAVWGRETSDMRCHDEIYKNPCLFHRRELAKFECGLTKKAINLTLKLNCSSDVAPDNETNLFQLNETAGEGWIHASLKVNTDRLKCRCEIEETTFSDNEQLKYNFFEIIFVHKEVKVNAGPKEFEEIVFHPSEDGGPIHANMYCEVHSSFDSHLQVKLVLLDRTENREEIEPYSYRSDAWFKMKRYNFNLTLSDHHVHGKCEVRRKLYPNTLLAESDIFELHITAKPVILKLGPEGFEEAVYHSGEEDHIPVVMYCQIPENSSQDLTEISLHLHYWGNVTDDVEPISVEVIDGWIRYHFNFTIFDHVYGRCVASNPKNPSDMAETDFELWIHKDDEDPCHARGHNNEVVNRFECFRQMCPDGFQCQFQFHKSDETCYHSITCSKIYTGKIHFHDFCHLKCWFPLAVTFGYDLIGLFRVHKNFTAIVYDQFNSTLNLFEMSSNGSLVDTGAKQLRRAVNEWMGMEIPRNIHTIQGFVTFGVFPVFDEFGDCPTDPKTGMSPISTCGD